jgi:putative phage-type endonuclease
MGEVALARDGSAYEFIGTEGDSRETWLARRRSGIGASEIAVVLGATGWSSVLGLYYRKLDGDDPNEDAEPVEHQAWGNLLQDAILTELAKRAGVTLVFREPHLRSTTHSWMLATPDALTADGEPVEAKNISYGFDEEDWEIGIPEKYYLQCQHQMATTGAKRCLFGVLLWGSRMIWEWIARDEPTIERIVKAGSQFWQRVLTRTEPPSDGHPDARKILGRLAVVETPVELFESELDAVLAEWATSESALKSIRASERATKKARDAAADQIAQAMGKHRVAFTATGWSFRWKTTNRAGFTMKPSVTNALEIKPPAY